MWMQNDAVPIHQIMLDADRLSLLLPATASRFVQFSWEIRTAHWRERKREAPRSENPVRLEVRDREREREGERGGRQLFPVALSFSSTRTHTIYRFN